MPTKTQIENFVRLISQPVRGMANVFNPWLHRDPAVEASKNGPERRRQMLKQYLNVPAPPRNGAVILVVGEAPGYRGCRYSGIPFGSERQLIEGEIPRVKLADRLTKAPKPMSEASATIVWDTFREAGLTDYMVTWNAFPWHPHEPENPMSNRAPTAPELRKGAEILGELLKILMPCDIIAVGRKAGEMLCAYNLYACAEFRHPSNGGAADFREGVRWFARNMTRNVKAG